MIADKPITKDLKMICVFRIIKCWSIDLTRCINYALSFNSLIHIQSLNNIEISHLVINLSQVFTTLNMWFIFPFSNFDTKDTFAVNT